MCCQSLSTFQLLGITIYNTFRDRVKRSTYKMLIFPALMYSNGSLGIRQLIYPPTGNFAKEKENCDTFFSSPFSFLVPLFSSTLSLSLSVSCSPWHLGLIRTRYCRTSNHRFPAIANSFLPDHEGYKLSDRSADRISRGGEKPYKNRLNCGNVQIRRGCKGVYSLLSQ